MDGKFFKFRFTNAPVDDVTQFSRYGLPFIILCRYEGRTSLDMRTGCLVQALIFARFGYLAIRKFTIGAYIQQDLYSPLFLSHNGCWRVIDLHKARFDVIVEAWIA